MRKYRYGWIGFGLLIVLLTVVLAACGGDDNKSNEPDTQNVAGTPTSLFPPTWTPVPTRTEPPRATIEYTYEAPLDNTTPGAFPTRAPATATSAAQQPASQTQQTPQGQRPPQSTPLSSPAGAAPTSSPTELVVSLEALNAAIAQQFGPIAGGFFEASPKIRFQGETIIADLTVYITPGKKDSARPVAIEMGTSVESGRVVLASQRVYFADDQSPYTDALAGYIMGAVETAINDLFNQQYRTVVPSGSAFTLTSITFTDNAITAKFSS